MVPDFKYCFYKIRKGFYRILVHCNWIEDWRWGHRICFGMIVDAKKNSRDDKISDEKYKNYITSAFFL